MKTLITILALSLAIVFSANAQVDKKADKNKTQSSKVQPEQDLTQQIESRTDQMTKDLNLTPDQVDRIRTENRMLYSNMHSIATYDVNGPDYKDGSTRVMDSYDANIRDILNEDQYRTYQNMKSGYMKDFHTPNQKRNQKTKN